MRGLRKGILYKKIYRRVLVIFYIVFIFIAFLFLRRQVRELTRKSREANSFVAQSISLQMDKNFNMGFKVLDQLALNERVQSFAIGDINYYLKIKTVEDMRTYGAVMKNFGAKATLFKPEGNDFLSESGIFHSYDVVSMYGYSPSETSFLENMEYGQVAFSEIPGCNEENSRYISFLCKRYTPDSQPIYFILSFYKDDLGDMLSENKTFDFEIADGEKTVFRKEMLRSGGAAYTEEIKSNILYNRIYKFKFELNMNYFIFGLFFLILFAMLFMLRFAAIAFTNMICSPINDIIRRISEYQDEDASDEMSYINEYVSRLSTENLLMKKQFELNEEWQKNQRLKDAVYGFKDVSAEEKDYFGSKLLSFVMFEFFSGNENLDIISYLVYEKEITDIVKLNDKQFLRLETETDINKVVRKTNELIKTVQEETGAEYTAVVPGRYVSDISELNNVYVIATTMLSVRVPSGNKRVMSPPDFDNIKINSYYYPFEIEKIIIENAARGQYGAAMKQVSVLVDENLYKMRLSQKSLTEFRFAIVATMKRVINALGKKEDEIFPDGTIMYVELNFAKSAEEIKKKILEMFEIIFKSSEKTDMQSANVIISSIIEYINENYHSSEKLTLINVAQKFNITTGYLSMLFKNETDVNFRDYVIRLRMEKAKELMRKNGTLKIKQISNMAGYDNPNSFIRTFKKYEGITPQMYRDSLNN